MLNLISGIIFEHYTTNLVTLIISSWRAAFESRLIGRCAFRSTLRVIPAITVPNTRPPVRAARRMNDDI